MTTTKHTLFEGVLNDDYMTKCDDGSVLITYYTFATEWSNNQHEKACYDMARAMRWYREKFHDRVVAQGKKWLEEDTEWGTDDHYTPEEYWTEIVCEQGMEV